MPDVSVVMPAYNAAAFVDEAVQSVLAQSHRDFELVVVDDGSTDASVAKLEAVARADPRVRLLRRQHGGIVAALNAGVEAARGRYVMRMDADDVALPDRMAKQAAYLDAHPEVAAVGGAIMLIDAEGRDLGRVDYPVAPADAAAALLRGCPLAHPAVMMRRDVVVAAGGYRPQFEYGEDYDLWLRVAERHQLANLPDIVLRYRQHVHKTSIARAVQQATATVAARAAAAMRRAGKVDPTDGVATLDDAVLERLGVDRQALAREQIDLLLAATVAAVNGGQLGLAAENLRLLEGYDVAHARKARLQALRDIARHHRRAGNWLAYVVAKLRARRLKRAVRSEDGASPRP